MAPFESVAETLLLELLLEHNIRYHLRYLWDKNRGLRAERKKLELLFPYFTQTRSSVKEEAKLKWTREDSYSRYNPKTKPCFSLQKTLWKTPRDRIATQFYQTRLVCLWQVDPLGRLVHLTARGILSTGADSTLSFD